MKQPEKWRKSFTLIFFVLIMFFYLLSYHSWGYNSWTSLIYEMLGIIFIMIGTFGRIWSYLYICGKKSKSLVQVGPYSITRNPLYIFSFIAAIGLGCASENLVVLALIIIAFIFYYPSIIKIEERKLKERHGEEFKSYTEKVPRFIPKSFNMQNPQICEVDPTKYLKVILDASCFVWLFVLLQIIEKLHYSGIIPFFWKIP